MTPARFLQTSLGRALPREKFFIGRQGFGGIHQGRAVPHIYSHPQRFLDFLACCIEVDQGLDMKADTAIAMGGNAQRERDQLFRLPVERAWPFGVLGERREGTLSSSLLVPLRFYYCESAHRPLTCIKALRGRRRGKPHFYCLRPASRNRRQSDRGRLAARVNFRLPGAFRK